MNISSNTQDLAATGDAASADPDTGKPIRQRQDALARQEAVVALGRRAIAPPELPILLQDAAELIAEMLDMEHSAVATVGADGVSLELQLRLRSSETGEFEQFTHESVCSGESSLADYALGVAHTVEVTDLAGDGRFQDVFLRGHAIGSAIAVPLQFQNCSFGVLIACSNGRCQLDTEDTLFAETLAYMVTTTVARIRAEDMLAEERRRSAGILQIADAIVLVLDKEGGIQHINQAGERVTGFLLAEIEGRRIGDVLPVPEEANLFQDLFEKLANGNAAVEYESFLLTKHSKRRRIAWSYAATTDSDGAIESILVTGIDITERREAEERAELAEKSMSETAGSNADSAANDRQPEDPVDGLPAGVLPSERRNRPRRAYPYCQKMAPVVDGTLPNPDEFTTIECNDISAGGFSYIVPNPPRSDSFVVALGAESSPTYLFAEIAHINPIERDGKQKYLVGCRYTGRAEY